jgi:hypothetical protein
MSKGKEKSLWILRVTAVWISIFLWSGMGQAQDQWPMEIGTSEGKVMVYQPQLESFRGDKVTGRAAISLQGKDDQASVFGVVWFSARALTDRDTRMVEFVDVNVERVKFSHSTQAQEKKWAALLEKETDHWEHTRMSLDRLLALTAAIEREKSEADKLNMDPPKIIFTKTPSALIVIHGKPELRRVENSDLERVINTPFIILYVPTTQAYYLRGGDYWYGATDILGPWKTVTRPPDTVFEVAKRISEPEDTFETAGQPKPKAPPQISVATEPAELVVSDGEPKFESVQGTGLLYLSNTPSEVFMEVATQHYYVLLSGRWYRSPSLDKGPWTYVPAEEMPSDFMKIPPGSAKGHILAFVGGTTQAKEAVLDAQIPQTAAIKRSEARLSVSYDGSPKFQRIKNTNMDYAINTGTQVIRVDGKYYACDEAVWFVSDSPTGPWVAADVIPPEIETIPPDSPVYNVKFVKVYDSTPEVVYVGYTPGYVGSYVYGGTVVYGTGYLYPAWIGAVYFPVPFTWGFAPFYDPFYCSWGYGWGFGAGFVSGSFWGFTAGVISSHWWHGWGWGGWHHWNHYWHNPHYSINRSINIERPVHANRPWGFQRPGGIRPEPRQNIYNQRGNIGRKAQRTGTAGPGRDVRGPGGTRPGQDPRGMPGGKPGLGSRGTRDRTGRQFDRSSPTRGNNVFADREGNVYRKTTQGWEQRTQEGWTRPETRPQIQQNFNQSRPSLDRDFGARQRGFERTRDFSRASGGYGGSVGNRRGSGGGPPGSPGGFGSGGSGSGGGVPRGGGSYRR